MPRAQSGPAHENSLWTIEFDNMSFTRSNFQDSSFGIAYEHFLTRQISLVISLETYSKSKGGYYKDYYGYSLLRESFRGDYAVYADYEGCFEPLNMFEGEFTPGHRLDISITPLQLSLKITPLGRRIKLIPYLGGGVGLYLWSVRLQGDLISFDLPDVQYYETQDYLIPVLPVYYADAIEGENFGRISFGYHLFGGFMFPVGQRLTLNAEFKFNNARAMLKKAFEGFTDPFDLSGYQISLGINYWF